VISATPVFVVVRRQRWSRFSPPPSTSQFAAPELWLIALLIRESFLRVLQKLSYTKRNVGQNGETLHDGARTRSSQDFFCRTQPLSVIVQRSEVCIHCADGDHAFLSKWVTTTWITCFPGIVEAILAQVLVVIHNDECHACAIEEVKGPLG
jgi:hypothetical protein